MEHVLVFKFCLISKPHGRPWQVFFLPFQTLHSLATRAQLSVYKQNIVGTRICATMRRSKSLHELPVASVTSLLSTSSAPTSPTAAEAPTEMDYQVSRVLAVQSAIKTTLYHLLIDTVLPCFTTILDEGGSSESSLDKSLCDVADMDLTMIALSTKLEFFSIVWQYFANGIQSHHCYQHRLWEVVFPSKVVVTGTVAATNQFGNVKNTDTDTLLHHATNVQSIRPHIDQFCNILVWFLFMNFVTSHHNNQWHIAIQCVPASHRAHICTLLSDTIPKWLEFQDIVKKHEQSRHDMKKKKPQRTENHTLAADTATRCNTNIATGDNDANIDDNNTPVPTLTMSRADKFLLLVLESTHQKLTARKKKETRSTHSTLQQSWLTFKYHHYCLFQELKEQSAQLRREDAAECFSDAVAAQADAFIAFAQHVQITHLYAAILYHCCQLLSPNALVSSFTSPSETRQGIMYHPMSLPPGRRQDGAKSYSQETTPFDHFIGHTHRFIRIVFASSIKLVLTTVSFGSFAHIDIVFAKAWRATFAPPRTSVPPPHIRSSLTFLDGGMQSLFGASASGQMSSLSSSPTMESEATHSTPVAEESTTCMFDTDACYSLMVECLFPRRDPVPHFVNTFPTLFHLYKEKKKTFPLVYQ